MADLSHLAQSAIGVMAFWSKILARLLYAEGILTLEKISMFFLERFRTRKLLN
jgi:hypothetical protein